MGVMDYEMVLAAHPEHRGHGALRMPGRKEIISPAAAIAWTCPCGVSGILSLAEQDRVLNVPGLVPRT